MLYVLTSSRRSQHFSKRTDDVRLRSTASSIQQNGREVDSRLVSNYSVLRTVKVHYSSPRLPSCSTKLGRTIGPDSTSFPLIKAVWCQDMGGPTSKAARKWHPAN